MNITKTIVVVWWPFYVYQTMGTTFALYQNYETLNVIYSTLWALKFCKILLLRNSHYQTEMPMEEYASRKNTYSILL